jgi:hypothetical protein
VNSDQALPGMEDIASRERKKRLERARDAEGDVLFLCRRIAERGEISAGSYFLQSLETAIKELRQYGRS